MSLESAITQISQEALAEVQTWDHYFQETRRRNKSVIPSGSVRNTIDTSALVSQISTDRSDRGIEISFLASDAEHIISMNSFRPEYAEIITTKIADEAAVLLVVDILKELGFNPQLK